MIEVKGSFNTAICYTGELEQGAYEQILTLCNQEAFREAKIRIMPDVHAGKGCTIGTTMTITDKVVPNLVGVDIGCGMYTVNLGKADIDYGVGDTVSHIKFGTGVVKSVVDGGRDYEVTVEFENYGVKKMFASFAKLKKV